MDKLSLAIKTANEDDFLSEQTCGMNKRDGLLLTQGEQIYEMRPSCMNNTAESYS